jgi:hypothetical protein
VTVNFVYRPCKTDALYELEVKTFEADVPAVPRIGEQIIITQSDIDISGVFEVKNVSYSFMGIKKLATNVPNIIVTILPKG